MKIVLSLRYWIITVAAVVSLGAIIGTQPSNVAPSLAPPLPDASREVLAEDPVSGEPVDAELATRPPDRLGPGERDRRRSASAAVLAVPCVEIASVKSGVPPGPEPPRRPPRLRDRRALTVTKPPPEGPVASARTTPPP